MNKRYLKAFLLGVGVGLIITSSMNIVQMRSENNIPSEEFIRSEAKKLGMVDPVEYIDKSKVINNPTNVIEPDSKPQDEVTKAPEVGKTINVYIPQGSNSEDIADLLLEEQLISSQKSFLDKVYSKNYSGILRWGNYKFNEGISEDEIIERLVKGAEE
ncbi:MAG: hypothetical protein ACOYVK_05220 [Bacillota bacterium]